jgi:hypothetical protein
MPAAPFTGGAAFGWRHLWGDEEVMRRRGG